MQSTLISTDQMKDDVINEISQVYLTKKLPWFVTFSGGKDSTAVLQLVYEMLLSLPENQRTNHIYVVSNDPLVDDPRSITRLYETTKLIKIDAAKRRLPISVIITKPNDYDTFWINVVGKGAPLPNFNTRWCCDRLKKRPSGKVIRDIDKEGKVVLVLGTRYEESNTRKRSMKKYQCADQKYQCVDGAAKAIGYIPIRNWLTDTVFEYLRRYESPFGDNNNRFLHEYYENGKVSRLGCWCCTVIKNSSLDVYAEKPKYHWLQLIVDFRKFLLDLSNNHENYREKIVKDGENTYGRFRYDVRLRLLQKLLEIRNNNDIKKNLSKYQQIITDNEIKIITDIWRQESMNRCDEPVGIPVIIQNSGDLTVNTYLFSIFLQS